jgi:hypothetical protein
LRELPRVAKYMPERLFRGQQYLWITLPCSNQILPASCCRTSQGVKSMLRAFRLRLNSAKEIDVADVVSHFDIISSNLLRAMQAESARRA